MLTPDQSPHLTPFNSNDPLAMGYMTQGQMGYLPQQQYLTPADYGAFRTLPSSNYSGMYTQRPGFLQNLAYSQGGYLGGIPIPTYNPAINMLQRQEMARRGIGDQATAWGGNLLDAGLTGLSMLNPYTAILGMAMPNFGAKMVDVHAQMRNIQNMTMSKITSGPDVSRSIGMGFSANKALSIEQFMRKSAAGDAFLKMDDYRSIMQKGMEFSMFDYSNDAESYKKVIKRLRNQTDVVLEMIDDKNVEGVMKNLKRLQDMGATGDISASAIRQEGMFSRMTGMRHTDMVNSYGQQGALIYSQYGLTGYQGSLSAMGTAAQLTMAQRMGLISPDLLARNGGLSGFTQKITEEGAAGMVRNSDFYLPFLAGDDYKSINPSALKDLMSGKTSLVEAMSTGAGRAGQGATDFSIYNTNKDQLLKDLTDKLGTLGEVLFKIALAQQMGQAMGVQGTQQQVSQGLQSMFGYSPQSARTLSELYTNREYLSGIGDQLTRDRNLIYAKSAERAKDESFWGWKTTLLSKVQDVFAPVYNAYSGYQERQEMAHARDSGVYGGRITSNTDSQAYRNLAGINTDVYKVGPSDVSQLPGENRKLGDISAKYESNKSGDAIGYDKEGGTSYGTYQISSKKSFNAFLKYAEDHWGEDGKRIADEMRAAGPANTGSRRGAAVDAWKRLRKAGLLSDERQYEYIKATYFDQAFEAIRDDGLKDLIRGSETLQEALFSTATQYGPGGSKGSKGAAGILNKVYRPGMSVEELLRVMYDEKGRRRPEARVVKELSDLLGMHALEKEGKLGQRGADAQNIVNNALGGSRSTGEYHLPKYIKDMHATMNAKIASISPRRSDYADNQNALIHASMISDSESTEALNTLGVTSAELVAYAGDMLQDVDIKEYSKGKDFELVKSIVKARNPNMSLMELEETARKIYDSPSVRKQLLNAYGKANTKELDKAKSWAFGREKQNLAATYKVIDEEYASLKSDLTTIMGGDRNVAERVLELNKKSGTAFGMVDLKNSLNRVLTSTGSTREGREDRFRAEAEAMGLKPEDIEDMLSSGDILGVKSSGLSKEELSEISGFAHKGKGGGLRSLEYRAVGLASKEALTAGESRLFNLNLTRGSIDSRKEIADVLANRTDLPPEIRKFLEELQKGDDAQIKNDDFYQAELSKAVKVIGPRTAEGTGPVSEAEKAALETNKAQEEMLRAFVDTLSTNGGKVEDNTKAIAALTTVLKTSNSILPGGLYTG